MNPTPMAQRRAAYTATAKALQRNEITKPDACTECGRQTTLYGHHPNYQEPLNIEWLCGSCHKRAHIEAGEVVSNKTGTIAKLAKRNGSKKSTS